MTLVSLILRKRMGILYEGYMIFYVLQGLSDMQGMPREDSDKGNVG